MCYRATARVWFTSEIGCCFHSSFVRKRRANFTHGDAGGDEPLTPLGASTRGSSGLRSAQVSWRGLGWRCAADVLRFTSSCITFLLIKEAEITGKAPNFSLGMRRPQDGPTPYRDPSAPQAAASLSQHRSFSPKIFQQLREIYMR